MSNQQNKNKYSVPPELEKWIWTFKKKTIKIKQLWPANDLKKKSLRKTENNFAVIIQSEMSICWWSRGSETESLVNLFVSACLSERQQQPTQRCCSSQSAQFTTAFSGTVHCYLWPWWHSNMLVISKKQNKTGHQCPHDFCAAVLATPQTPSNPSNPSNPTTPPSPSTEERKSWMNDHNKQILIV